LIIVNGYKIRFADYSRIKPEHIESIIELEPKDAIEVFGEIGKDGAVVIKLISSFKGFSLEGAKIDAKIIEKVQFYAEQAKLREQERLKVEEEAKKADEERGRLEEEAQAKKEAEEKARLEAEDNAKKEAEEKARLEAEANAKKISEEKARLEAEANAKKEAEEKARLEAEAEAKKEAEEKAR